MKAMPNNSMHRMALRAAADAERSAHGGSTEMTRRPIRSVPLLALMVSSSLACATATVPAALSPEDAALVSKVRIPATVGVERYDPAVYSERLISSLRSTGLFEDVGPLDEIDDPDLIASVRRPIYGTASVLPVLTLLTLGIVPTWVSEEWGESFTISNARARDSEVEIEFTYSGPSTLGWAALLLAPLPKHALGRPYDKPRFRRAFAAAIAREEDQIRRLLQQ